MYKRNIEMLSCKHCCREKATSITCFVCVSVASVAVSIQHVKHMHCIIVTSVACQALPRFCTLSHKWHHFQGGGKVLIIRCVF
jgi:hypothetical protein